MSHTLFKEKDKLDIEVESLESEVKIRKVQVKRWK